MSLQSLRPASAPNRYSGSNILNYNALTGPWYREPATGVSTALLHIQHTNRLRPTTHQRSGVTPPAQLGLLRAAGGWHRMEHVWYRRHDREQAMHHCPLKFTLQTQPPRTQITVAWLSFHQQKGRLQRHTVCTQAASIPAPSRAYRPDSGPATARPLTKQNPWMPCYCFQ